MTITVFTGLPGAGKTSRLIDMVNAAIAHDRPVLTFSCSESPLLLDRQMRSGGVLGSRRPGHVCPLHHFVSTNEGAMIVDATPAGTFIAFDEAYHFGTEIALSWIRASQRGLEVLIVTPSRPQLLILKDYNYREETFNMECQRCHNENAETAIILPDETATLSLCFNCNKELSEEARREIIERLERQSPYPGEKVTYQPVELEECKEWKVLRPDSRTRANLMNRIIREAGLIGTKRPKQLTYLDIGCNTGYFCHHMSQLGFCSEGVDVVEDDIQVAKLLDSFIRKDNGKYVVADAYNYLSDTQEKMFDVTSAFAVFQWLILQTTVERGIECLEWLFVKTKCICFLEMGYTAEGQYKDQLKVNIDRNWVFNIMQEKGNFAQIYLLDAQKHNLMFGSRDLFVGIKAPLETASA